MDAERNVNQVVLAVELFEAVISPTDTDSEMVDIKHHYLTCRELALQYQEQ
jgi:hypothetical protein